MSTTDTAAHHITLTTPISREDIEDIRVGDVVFLDGHITTCRDVAHRRLIEYGRELPVDIRDGAILHAGPIIRMIDEEANRFEVVAVGPTTSMRRRTQRLLHGVPTTLQHQHRIRPRIGMPTGQGPGDPQPAAVAPISVKSSKPAMRETTSKIGRASCRERV